MHSNTSASHLPEHLEHQLLFATSFYTKVALCHPTPFSMPGIAQSLVTPTVEDTHGKNGSPAELAKYEFTEQRHCKASEKQPITENPAGVLLL